MRRPDTHTFVIEVGHRAALYAETQPCDVKWFRWLFRKGRR